MVMAFPEACEENPSVGGGYSVRRDGSPEHGPGEQKQPIFHMVLTFLFSSSFSVFPFARTT